MSETFWTSQICACCSPHHCVGFLFFAWIPPGLRAASSSSFASSAAAPSLTHSHTHTHSLTLTHSFTHSLTPSLTHSLIHLHSRRASWRSCGARGRRWAAAAFLVAGAVHRASWLPFAWQAQCTEPPGGAAARVAAAGPRLLFSWPPLGRGCLSRGPCSTQSFLAAFRVAGAVHRASWRSCGARGRRWAAAAFQFLVAGAVHRASWLPFAWKAQYTEPPGGAAARVAAAGPRLPFSWQVQYTELLGCLSCGRRSAQSLLEELRRAWPPLGRGCLSRGPRST